MNVPSREALLDIEWLIHTHAAEGYEAVEAPTASVDDARFERVSEPRGRPPPIARAPSVPQWELSFELGRRPPSQLRNRQRDTRERLRPAVQ